MSRADEPDAPPTPVRGEGGARAGWAGAVQARLNPGVRKRELWAWAMYDFANSGYTTVVLTTLFNTYFVAVVAGGAAWATLAWTAALSVSYLLVMVLLPTLAARADARAAKRRLLFASTAGCVAGTAALYFAGPGMIWLAMGIIIVSNTCYSMGESAIASFLPELARSDSLGQVSGWGWGCGYFGGMLTLALALAVVGAAESRGLPAAQAVPWVMVVTACVFALAALPAFLLLRERAAPRSGEVRMRGVFERLLASWRETGRHYPDFRRLLLCIVCYQAGVAVVVTLAAVYASEAMGFGMTQIILMVFVVNIAAALGAFVFGRVQDAIGHGKALALTLFGWLAMVATAYAAVRIEVFWVAAMLAGLCMGSSQSAGRAMTGALAPPGRLSEFFALWTFAQQLAAAIGPLSYGLMTWATGGNHRLAILTTGLFFAGGLLLLRGIDMPRGIAARARHI